MKRKKLNCTCGKPRQGRPIFGGLLALVLAALLLAVPAMAANDNGAVPQAVLPNKPEVKIQGNVVVDDNGAPTGFYELALCVRSPRRIYGPDPATGYTTDKELSEAEYATALAAIEAGTAVGVSADSYMVTYYPFSAASAVVGVNTDVLTAVNWDVESVTYSDWNGMNYAANDTDYPRGIDLTPTTGGNFDPDVWGPTDPDPFPDVTVASLQKPNQNRVALDAEGDRSAFTAAAQVEQYYEDPANSTKAAIVTLSAHAPDNKPVVYKTSTPVAVIRFAYDLKRFPKNVVMVNATYNAGDLVNQITGDSSATNATGFWLGKDRATGYLTTNGKTPLTWLADTAMDTAGAYSFSDGKAAATEAGQVVWTKLSSKDTAGAPVDWNQTEYYYYLGANGTVGGSNAADPDGSVSVATPAGIQTVEHVRIPDTKGVKILAPGSLENPTPGAGDSWTAAEYSYYVNILHLDGPAEGRGLRLEMVNAPTFRAPRGGKGGNQILFYDWDDTLIGALIVGKGDVRRDVNAYVENNLVHPELRAGKVLSDDLGGVVPDYSTGFPVAGSAEETYYNLMNSLDREHTYRGQYPSTPSPEGTTAGTVSDGEAYPLTNKLDYVFYKHLNTVTTVETEDATGKSWTENYFTLAPLTDDVEAAKYPWAYGWAIVEDAVNQKVPNKTGWPVMVDSVKLENTWTTMGVGELENVDPAAGNVNTSFAVPATGTTVESVYPGGLGVDWSADAGRDPAALGYTYSTSSADANGYLRFADFSDMSTLLKDGQDVLIVKAVYEPGTNLDLKGYYSIVPGSLNISRLGTASSSENSIYAFDYQYQRANASTGNLIGVGRTRDPAVRTGFVFDAKAVDTKENLDAQKTFFLKNVGANTDIMDIQLTTGGALWKLEYTLLDIYGLNISNGTTRSLGGEWNLKTGFEYETPADPTVEWVYDERQGTDGFVVEATINTLLAEATKEAKEAGSGSLTNHASLRTIQDLNFKRNINKDGFTGVTVPRFVTYLQDLVNRLYDDGVAIDPKTGNVVLGWHQIQQHILMCEAAGGIAVPGIYSGGVLKSEGECIAIGYEWCRMDTCGGNSTMPINSVNDVLKALNIINKGSSDPSYNPAYKAIYGEAGTANTGVAATDLYGYGYRQHADGVPYNVADPNLKDTILNDLKDAVKLLAPTLGSDPDWSTVTWTQLQEAIIRGNMGAATPPTLNLWWQPTASAPNGTPPSINNWDDLWKYSIQTTLGVDMDGNGTLDAVVPDAFNSFDQTALDALVSEKPGTSTATNLGWFRTGKVVTVDGEETAEKFTADEFRTAWGKALKALTSAPAPYTAATVTNATWEEIQYALINGTYKSHMDIVNDTSIDYWWKNGGSPKLTFAKLLDAVNDFFFNGDSTKLDDILKAGPNPINNEVYLRADDGGTEFETAAEFKTAINTAVLNFLAYTGNSSDFLDSNSMLDPAKVDEYVLQYILIHRQDFMNGTISTVPDKAAIKADTVNNDYWWFAGGVPTKPMPLRTVKDLFKAYLWYKGNTSTGVGGQNAQALGNLDAATLKAMGLRADDWGVAYGAGATNAELIAAVEKALAKLPYNMKAINSISEADLALEVQYLLANPTAGYQSAGVLRGQNVRYWWQEGDKSYPAPTNQKEVLEAVWKAYVGNAAGNTVPEAETALKALDIDFITKRNTGLAMRKDADGNAFASAGAFYTALTKAADAMKAGGQSYADLGSITQRQLQWMLLGNAYDTDANIQDATIDKTDPANPVDAYWWFTSDKKPDQGGPTTTQKPLDESKVTWNDFINAGWEYALNWDNGPMDGILGVYDESLLNDDFLLRKSLDETDTFTSTGDLYDCSWADKLYDVINLFLIVDRTSDFSTDGFSFDVRVPTWDEFQYVLIHYNDIMASGNILPSLDDIEAEAQEKYTWRYETSGGPTPPEPEKEEKPLDESNATWNDFMSAAWEYALNWDNGPIDNILGVYDENLLNDDFLLRQSLDETDKFTSTGDLYDCSWADKLYDVINMFLIVDRTSDFSTDGFSFDVRVPTWHEFQYALIHYNDIMTGGNILPSLDDIETEAKEKYTWRYTTPAAPPPPAPPKTEKPIDESSVTWSDFINATWEYVNNWDDSFMNAIFPPYDESLLNDDFLLRKSLCGETFGSVSELYDDSWGDKLYDVICVFFIVDRTSDFSSDGFTFDLAIPTWYEFQYVIIHYNDIMTNGNVLPSLEDIKAECEANYDWKYES